MTDSEILRFVLAIILILIVVARRQGWFTKLKENREKKKVQAAKQQRLEDRKARRQRQQEEADEKKTKTAEILRRGVTHMRQKSVVVAGEEVWYLESPSKLDAQTVLLLHGFAGNKENWTELARSLIDKGFHVVAPDLPGFGQSGRHPDKSYDITTQTKRIRLFVQKAGLERFHLVGHSIGGSIAAAVGYAAPNEVASLTLIEPFGIHVPYESELDTLLKQGRNPLVIANPTAYDNLLGFVYHQPPELPPALKKLQAEQAAESRVFFLKVWKETREGERANLLDLLLPVLKMPTLYMQGAKSKVLHESTPSVVQSMMGEARTVMIDDCGHFPMVEKADVTAHHLSAFLEGVADHG